MTNTREFKRKIILGRPQINWVVVTWVWEIYDKKAD